jgi:hypothetical protein
MNFGELKTRALSDYHREDYTAYIAIMVAEGEALIESQMEAFALTATLTDANRVGTVYTLPASRVTLIKHVYISTSPLPLTQTDETQVAVINAANGAQCTHFAVRPNGVLVFGGSPSAGSTITVNYFGMPARLVLDADTNQLLTDYPQLYLEATGVYILKRAKDLEGSSAAYQSVASLIRELNRRMKKMIGGSEAVGPYNVEYGSSY